MKHELVIKHEISDSNAVQIQMHRCILKLLLLMSTQTEFMKLGLDVNHIKAIRCYSPSSEFII